MPFHFCLVRHPLPNLFSLQLLGWPHLSYDSVTNSFFFGIQTRVTLLRLCQPSFLLLHLLAQGVLYFDMVYHVKSAEIIPSSGSFPCILLCSFFTQSNGNGRSSGFTLMRAARCACKTCAICTLFALRLPCSLLSIGQCGWLLVPSVG